MSNNFEFQQDEAVFSSLEITDHSINTDERSDEIRILKRGLPIIALTSLVLFTSVITTGQYEYIAIVSISFVLLFVEYMLAIRGHVVIASYIVSLTPSVMIAYSYVYYLDFNDEISIFFSFWLSIFFAALFLKGVHYIISLILTLLTIAFTLQVIEGFTTELYIEHFDLLFTFSLAVMFATALFFGRHLMASLLVQEIEKMNKANKKLLVKTQEMEEARIEAESASKNKSMFLASVSHELRTPLNGIINFSAFVQKGKFGDVAPQHAHMISRIHDSGHELLKLVNNVLDSSKIASDSFMLFYEDDVTIEELLDGFDQISNFRFKNTKGQIIADADISFSLEGIDQNYPFIRLDTDRIRQALFEVLTLCFYYTISGFVRMKVSQSSNSLVIQIEDSSGSALNNITSNLFDLTKLSTNEIVFHIGLGLSIAKEIIELHHGNITYNHEIKGNVFQIKLPVFKEHST